MRNTYEGGREETCVQADVCLSWRTETMLEK